jgi:hypothetical protein
MPFIARRDRGEFPSETARAIFLMRRRLNLSRFEFSRLVGFGIEYAEANGGPVSVERLIGLLRQAATEEERTPLLAELASRNIHPSDLSPALLGGPGMEQVHA